MSKLRLICPNCGAQYEVPRDAIPEQGRDVQCSNCGDTWFQAHPDHDPALDADLGRAVPDAEWDPDDTAPPPEPTRRELDAAVAEVLREEREREAQMREQETGGAAQPSRESDEERRERETRERMARLRGEDPAMAAGAQSRRDLLPDIEEIDSELDTAGEKRAQAQKKRKPAASPKRRRRQSFRFGFGTTLLAAAAAISAYVYAPQIRDAVPQSAPYLETYVTQVNQGRVWLDAQMTEWMLWLDQKAAAAGGNTEGPASVLGTPDDEPGS